MAERITIEVSQAVVDRLESRSAGDDFDAALEDLIAETETCRCHGRYWPPNDYY